MDKINEKLAKFKIDCIKRAEQEADDLQIKIKNEIDRQVEEEMLPYMQIQESKFEKDMKKVEREYYASVYAQETELKQKIIEKKQEIEEDFKESLQEKICQFVKTKKYEEFLYKNIEEALNKIGLEKAQTKDTKLYLTKQDTKKYEEKIKEIYPDIKIETMESENIGGCRLLDKKTNAFVDNTLKLAIEEHV